MTSVTETPKKPITSTTWWVVLLEGIAAVILGVLLLVSTEKTMTLLTQLLGVYFLFRGILDIVLIFTDKTMWGAKLVSGIIGILAGLIILRHPLWAPLLVTGTIIILFGIAALIIGLRMFLQGFREKTWGYGVLGLFLLVLGILLILNPVVSAVATVNIIAVFGIIGGLTAIILSFTIDKGALDLSA